jgi:hypothetical protein
MTRQAAAINFHKFVDDELAKNGFRIINADEIFIKTRLKELVKYVNDIRLEYSDVYGWKGVDEQFFLNPMVDKWKYSFVVLNQKDEICFLNFSSVYGDIIHNHCTYAGKQSRGKNCAKLHIIKLCQTGLDNGFTHQEGYWPKNNNGSIILFLKMGWQIEKIRDDIELFMIADLEKVRNQTYQLVLSGK